MLATSGECQIVDKPPFELNQMKRTLSQTTDYEVDFLLNIHTSANDQLNLKSIWFQPLQNLTGTSFHLLLFAAKLPLGNHQMKPNYFFSEVTLSK